MLVNEVIKFSDQLRELQRCENVVQEYFHFVAQTGMQKGQRFSAPSNFHVYKLPYESLTKVEEAVRSAKKGVHGLEYTAEFLWWLEHNDQNKS